MRTAVFHFETELRPLLPKDRRGESIEVTFNGEQSVKHLVESLGVPHTEVGEVLANGEPVGLGTITADGDSIEVRAVKPGNAGSDNVEPRFVLDNHLGRLAAYLRMLGLDSLYDPETEDPQLAEISAAQGRILLTRDRRLLMRKTIVHGCLVRSLDPQEQLVQIVRRYRLKPWIKPFRRCMRCNHPIEPVAKKDVLHRLEPLTKKYYDDFRICPSCDGVYWKGSHYERMLALIETTVSED